MVSRGFKGFQGVLRRFKGFNGFEVVSRMLIVKEFEGV